MANHKTKVFPSLTLSILCKKHSPESVQSLDASREQSLSYIKHI